MLQNQYVNSLPCPATMNIAVAKMLANSFHPNQPSLSSLPTGLKLCILDYCLPGAFSALSRVNQDFHRISQDFDMTTILLKSEYFHESYLRANHLYPCYSCCRLLPSSYFADDEKINERSYAGQGAHLRGCLSCRLIGLSHLSRDFVLYRGSYEFRCLSCNRFCGIKIFNSACRPTLLNNPSDHLPLWKRKRAEFYNAWVRSRLQEDTTRKSSNLRSSI